MQDDTKELRDLFAALAMMGDIAHSGIGERTDERLDYAAREYYRVADSMVRVRDE